MKKLITLFLMLMICGIAHARITVDAYLVSSDVTIPQLNINQNRMVDEINSLPGDNIQSGTITSDHLDDNTNPVKRWDEAFNDFVFTGLLPPTTSGTLTSTTTLGTAYIEGVRVVKDATANAYTATKWTYVDLSSSGTYTYPETAIDASEPTTTSNSIRLVRVTTNATEVTAVQDKRVTSISIGTNQDHYITGMELSHITPDVTAITVDAGVVYVGATRVAKADETAIVMATGADWWDGAADNYTKEDWCYIGVDIEANIKFLGLNPPDKSDTSGNTGGILRYWFDTTVPEYWRVIGRVRLNSSEELPYEFYQTGNTTYYVKSQSFVCGAATSFTEVDLGRLVASIDVEAYITDFNSTASTINSWRNAKNNGTANFRTDHNGDAGKFGGYWMPIFQGTTFGRAIDYKVSSNEMTGDIEAVRTNIR